MIRIIVDSSSDYQLEEIKQKNMELVPLSITIGEHSYLDGINLDRDDFYKTQRNVSERLPGQGYV